MERYILISDYYQRKNNNHIFYDKKVITDKNCSNPWTNLIINQNGDSYICSSPAWIPKSIGSILDYDNIFDLLNSNEALLIRQEILNGRYFYCNAKICGPFFPTLDKSSYCDYVPTDIKDLAPLTTFSKECFVKSIPMNIIFDFDYTCNFVCPSCRLELINHNKTGQAETNKKIVEKIKKLIIDKIDSPCTIRWAGGEPFISNAYLDLWEYIAKSKNVNIKNIIQTNGSYLKKKQDLLVDFLPNIGSIRISFDAGTEKTYAKLRVNGNWETLIDNAKWLRHIIDDKKADVKLLSDFVVQKDNYLEIPEYIKICQDIGFDKIVLSKMWNWNTYSDHDFLNKNISDAAHPEHAKFLDIINQPHIRNNSKIGTANWPI